MKTLPSLPPSLCMISASCICIALLLLSPGFFPARSAPAKGRQGVVATIHPLATDAALQAMKQAGKAIDAAVAAALTLGVVDGHNSGIGGGCFMLIRLSDGSIAAIDGRETAPAGARVTCFCAAAKPI